MVVVAQIRESSFLALYRLSIIEQCFTIELGPREARQVGSRTCQKAVEYWAVLHGEWHDFRQKRVFLTKAQSKSLRCACYKMMEKPP